MSTDRRELNITHSGSPAAARSMYDERFLTPMRRDLTEVGFTELRTADDVDEALKDKPGTAMVLVNSVCGCAAGGARPALRMALQSDIKPDQVVTVFAGQDRDATEKARTYLLGYPPSSPQISILRDGKVVHMIQRHHIEGRTPEMIAEHLKEAFKVYCAEKVD